MKAGPIILIEDDEDDKAVIEEVLGELKITNELIWFDKSQGAYDYLLATSDQPFIILSDVNLPGKTGIDLKSQIDGNEYLRKKSIPFIFYSTSVDQETVNVAYTELTVQGFFQKQHRYEEIKAIIKLITDYWKVCRHPNSRD